MNYNLAPATASEYNRKWRQEHVAEKKLMDAAWREANPERVRQMQRDWRNRNKDRINAKRKARRAELRAIERTNEALTAHQRMKRDRGWI
jgi:hypothetical protein